MSEEGKEAKKSFWRASKQKIKNIERPEKKRNKLQKDTSRRVAVFVWSLLLFTAIFTALGIFLSLNTRSLFNDLSREVKQPEKETALRSVNTIAGQNFLKDFIPAYINVRNNADALKKRQETLQTYLAKQADNNMEESPFDVAGIKGNRIFKSSSLYNTVEQDKTTIFQYQVTFINQTVTERTVEKKVKKGKGKRRRPLLRSIRCRIKKKKNRRGF
ncbi:Conjugative transposon protein TcpC [Listeria grayi]|uniref:Conjugative transposon protein TcpC n=1 Tax=Listeria grayi TaxID=1641 RepID=A0A378MEG5_LISGR|nr:conjugal transfer protein [Listeria grayi]STY44204.1 Conjugative transposon protein TcpC [Listeria grayi]